MATRSAIFLFFLFCAMHEVRLRSLDQIIEDVEIEYSERNDTDLMDKFPSKVWYDYAMAGRKEELVKVQLDLVMTKEHWDTVIDTDDALPRREKRNAVKGKTNLWPRRIPYVINDGFDIEDRLELIMAMDHWEEHTCLKFVEAKKSDSDYIEFVPDPSSCESLLGRMQRRQPINLAPPCMNKAVIVHEIGHALGLYHEHMRADRDDYVKVHYKNVMEEYHSQFDKLKPEHYKDYGKPYDYESIMHYGKLYYSLNRTGNLLTIEPKNASYLDVIGEGSSLSFLDVQIANDMYECSRGCAHKVCLGNGFLGKNCDCYCTGKSSTDIVLCGEAENCGIPDISISEYLVYTNNFDVEIKEWNETLSYIHGTKFFVAHKNESCGLEQAIFNCTDGQWEGVVPPCEKACIVEDYDDKYLVTNNSLTIAKPGDMVISREELRVSCKLRRREDDMNEEFIECFDGIWSTHINDVECKGRTLCTMVLNAQVDGTLEDGFTVTCSQGYELETKGGPGNKFKCSWEGLWEPVVPVCIPAKCTIPATNDAKFYQKNDELFIGSVVNHGSDVTLKCARKYIPVEETIPCINGKWKTENGKFPSCRLASCKVQEIRNGGLYLKNGREINDDEVMHGSDVTLKCDRGHIPDEITFSCKLREWGTSDGKFPKCTLVECPAPTVERTTGYKPMKEKYIYGEQVRVGLCKGNLALEGSRKLKCLKTGDWSDSAICKAFCSHGEDDFKARKNTAIQRSVRHRNLGIASFSGCERTCKNYKRFLCLAFVYGFEKGRHHCRLYRWSTEMMENRFEKKLFWTTGIRTCPSKKQ